MKKNGFTLIELLAAILLLAIVSIIAYPFVSSAIKGSKESALERTIDNLKHAAYTYSVENLYEQNIEERTIFFDELFNMGYIKKMPVNTVTNEELIGCIMYKWENNQYSFRYEENCNIEQIEEFVINFKPLATSNNGWYKSNLFVNVTINGSYYDWCSATSECSPTTRVTSKTGTVLISN